MHTKRNATGLSVLVCLTALLIGLSWAQDTSTPTERKGWVETTQKLESRPLDELVNREGEAALKRVSDVHDFHVPLCPALLNEFNGMKYEFSHTITRQYMLASAAYLVENPDKAADNRAMNMAALQSVLKTYEAILQENPELKPKLSMIW